MAQTSCCGTVLRTRQEISAGQKTLALARDCLHGPEDRVTMEVFLHAVALRPGSVLSLLLACDDALG
jgi:hypothetical protein